MKRVMGGRFEVDLGVPDLAYLLDHVVAGRSIMPGAAMFETGLAAAQSLLPDPPPATEQSDGGEHGLAAAVIPQAVLLKATASRLLRCTVMAATGAVELGGQSGACGCLPDRFIWNNVVAMACQSALSPVSREARQNMSSRAGSTAVRVHYSSEKMI